MSDRSIIAEARTRDVVKGGLVGGSSRLVAMGVGFGLLPLTIHRAGSTSYGLFAALTSFSALLTFADFGIGNGLISRLTIARTLDDDAGPAIVTATALLILTLTGVAIAALGAGFGPHLPWPSWLHASQSSRDSLNRAVVVLALCVGVAVPGALAQKVYLSFQRASQANLWAAAASVASSITLVSVAGTPSRLPLMVAAQLGMPALFGLAAVIWLAAKRRVSVKWSNISLKAAVELMRSGRLFAVLQTAAVVNYEVDAIIVSHFRGPTSVTTFTATALLFAAPMVVATFFYTPLWAAFADASARGDAEWIRRTYGQAIRAGVYWLLPVAAILGFTGGPLVRVWTHGAVHPPGALVIALAVWTVVFAMNQPQAMLLNALHEERFQLKITAATVVANVVLSVVLTVNWGISGPIWGTVIAQVFCAIAPATLYLHQHVLRDRPEHDTHATAHSGSGDEP